MPPEAIATAEAPAGTMTAPPALRGVALRASELSQAAFRVANRYVVVPFHQAGLAAWLGSPLTGWQCLITTRGRRSGLPRPTPLGYLIAEGAAWMMAGYGPQTQWYRNLLADPHVELRLPGRPPIAAIAEEARDRATRARIMPPLVRSMAVPGVMCGCVPATSSDERILDCVSWVPLVRIRAADGRPLTPGPDDPGGRAWIWRQGVLFLALGGLLPVIRRLLRI